MRRTINGNVARFAKKMKRNTTKKKKEKKRSNRKGFKKKGPQKRLAIIRGRKAGNAGGLIF